MKTICHIITGLFADGAEMMLYKLLSNTDRSRFQPVVISLMDRGVLGGRIEDLGIPVYTAGMTSVASMLRATGRLSRTLRHIRPDLIQGWMYHGNLMAQIAAVFLPKRVPVLWNIRGSHYSLLEEKLTTAALVWLGGKLSGLPVKIINNSQRSAIQHEQRLGYRADKRVIIPNGFDTDVFVPSDQSRDELRTSLGLSQHALLIGLIGRYHPVKDHKNFLHAAAIIHKSVPEAHFVLAGRGVDEQSTTLVQQISDCGLTEKVHLLGERPDIERVAAGLDIVSSTSYSEGFSNVIGEAMSCGIPCVVTDVGDSAWIVGDTGRVVPPKDSKALANAWKELIEIEAIGRKTLGLAARDRILGYFSLPYVVQQYETLYEQVVEKGVFCECAE